jgi:hypothetical protein
MSTSLTVGICFIVGYQQSYALIPCHRSNRIPAYRQPSSHAINSMQSAYIEEGYNITLTDAPNDLGGRLCRNCALTTPELPVWRQYKNLWRSSIQLHTVWPSDLSPNDSNL